MENFPFCVTLIIQFNNMIQKNKICTSAVADPHKRRLTMMKPPVISAPVQRGTAAHSGNAGSVQSYVGYGIPSEGADQTIFWNAYPSEGADQAWISPSFPSEGAEVSAVMPIIPSEGADQASNWAMMYPSEGADL